MDEHTLDVTKAYIESLGKRHVTVNLGFAAIALVVILAFGGIYLHSVQNYERMLGKAEEREAKYEQTNKELAAQLLASQERIAELTVQQSQIHERVVYRDKQTDAKIAEVLAPEREAVDVAQDVKLAYNTLPLNVEGRNFLFELTQVQTFVATKIDRDRLSQKVVDTEKLYADEQEKTALLQADLGKAIAQLHEATGVIEGYKKVAKRSKWRKVWDGVQKYGGFALGIVIGRKL